MNDHAGWTKDLKCVLCGSDDASKPCAGLPEDDGLNGAASILKEEDERIMAELKNAANKKEFDLSMEYEHFRKVIASGLNVEKEIEQYNGKLLADQISKEEQEIIKSNLELIKNTIRKICEGNIIADHKCLGVVPNTFIICGEDNYQYCSEGCETIAKAVKGLKEKLC